MTKRMLSVNGLRRTLIVDPEHSLADVLRRQLLLTGCKTGCNQGQCGACTVLVNGRVVRSCVEKMRNVPPDAEILSIEGLGSPGNLHPLQLAWMANGAVQCGFCAPGFILSAKALLDARPSPSRGEVRDWFESHRNACRCTGYRPLVDAVMAAAKVLRGELRKEDLGVRTPKSVIEGTSSPKPSDIAKVTGACDYGADVALRMPAGTLRLALVQSPHPHARIVSVDVSAAERMPGVVAVLRASDIGGTNRIAAVLRLPGGDGMRRERPILCDRKVFQFGDAVAIAAADTEANAKEAARRVVVEYEILAPSLSAPSALSNDAPSVHEGARNEFFSFSHVKGGDAAAVMESAAHVVEAEFYCSRQPHLTIECDSGFAYFDESGRLAIHSKSTALDLHREMIAEGLGLPSDRLVLHSNPSGGAFGYKQSPTVEALLGAACLATGRPASLVYSMFQSITYTGKRSPGYVKLRLGADAEGRIVAVESDWTIDHGPYSEFGDILTSRVARFVGAGYAIPNIRGIGRAVATNHAWGAPFRAFGAPQAFLAMECLLDELAEKVGLDPFEARLRNVYRPGATTPLGTRPDVYCLESMFELLRPRYEAAKKRRAAAVAAGRSYGVGIALGVYDSAKMAADPRNGTPVAYTYELFMPEVEVDAATGKATVRKFTTVVDVGTIINKNELDGQILGGIAQGIGLALSEEFENVHLHSNLVSCGFPYIKDIPDDVEILYSVTPRPHGPYGSADAREIALTAPHAAILNAIRDACGVRIRSLPARPEKIRAALVGKP